MKIIKTIGLSILCTILEWQVVRLRKRHTFTLIAVAGSLGKTSTKIALAELLVHAGKRVRYQTGNFNVRLTVPLVIFDKNLPELFNLVAWCKIFLDNEQTIRRQFDTEYVVVELGTDAPGQMVEFSYLEPDLGILTAIAPEHMENFANLDAVAREEFTLATYAKSLLINSDDVALQYLPDMSYTTYGINGQADYSTESLRHTEKGQEITIAKQGEKQFLQADVSYLGTQGMKILVGAVAGGDMLGLSKKQIVHGLVELRPFAGRMQRLQGVQGTILIDDTYNAAPASVLAALDVMDDIAAPQHIAILGSMNELGDYTQEAHRIVGKALVPQKLDLVVTIGADAEKYMAPVAKQNGCTVMSFTSPYDAGACVLEHLKSGAVVLAKGSQNRVFAEEALKLLLKNPKDSEKLVRQTPYWLGIKHRQFPGN